MVCGISSNPCGSYVLATVGQMEIKKTRRLWCTWKKAYFCTTLGREGLFTLPRLTGWGCTACGWTVVPWLDAEDEGLMTDEVIGVVNDLVEADELDLALA